MSRNARWLCSWVVASLVLSLQACNRTRESGDQPNAGTSAATPAPSSAGTSSAGHAGEAGAQADAGASGASAGASGQGGQAGTVVGGSGGVSAAGSAGESAGDAGTSNAGAAGSDAGAGSGGSAGAQVVLGGTGGSNGCLEGITDFTSQGPFTFETASLPHEDVQDRIKAWVPQLPSDCRTPIVHFAVGTGGACWSYAEVIEHLASHGFLVTCYESARAEAGMQCIAAIEVALATYPELADHKVGSTGHSSGAAAALMCAGNAEEKWGDALSIVAHAAEPDSGVGAVHPSGQSWAERYAQITSPVFMFNGDMDILVSERRVQDAFDGLDPMTEAYWYEGVNVTHVPVPVEHINGSAIPWLRWKLLGDRNACEVFHALPDTESWDMQAAQSARDC